MGQAKVVASLATMPSRLRAAWMVLETIAPQVDEVRVYLNGFRQASDFTAGWAAYSRVAARVRFQCSEQNRGDQMKFAGVVGAQGFDFTVTLDDDVHYPPDCIATLVKFGKRFNGEPVGWHGARLLSRGQVEQHGYYAARKTFHCAAPQHEVVEVDVLGTGIMCFSPKRLALELERDFRSPNMADIWFAIAAKKAGLTLRVVPHCPVSVFPGTTEQSIYMASKRRDGSIMDTKAAQTKAVLDHWHLWRPRQAR